MQLLIFPRGQQGAGACGYPYVVFMVPDFSGLDKESSAIAASQSSVQSSEPSPGAASREMQSFSQKLLPFCEKPLNPSGKSLSFCAKPIENAAKHRSFVPTFQQKAAPQTAATVALVPPPIPERDYTHLFYQLWLTHPSWSPILLTANGWITVKGSGKKQVPLTLKTIESYYRRGHIIGKRFGQLTHYLMLDLDINSPFHPDHGGFHPILMTMERFGLCRYLIVRSSTSGGLHLYFPLPEPVNSWQLAYTAHSALTADGIQIAGGICELFPNKKAFNAEHNGHRLPLQNGSFLLDDDFCPISNHKADFVTRWETAAAHQDNEALTLALNNSSAVYAPPSTPVELPPVVPTPPELRPPAARTPHILPPIAWTRFGQSNDVMRELANYGDRYAGHRNSTDLASWITAVAPQLSGYQKFASPKSKRDIEDGTWPKRWAESHFRSAWLFKVSGSDHNAKVAADAKARIFAALDRMCIDPDIKFTELWRQVSSTAKVCFDLGVGWKTFIKYKDEIWLHVKRCWKLGLSSRRSEDINSFGSALPNAQSIESGGAGKKGVALLLTLRCVTSIYSSTFAQLHTSQNGAELGGCAMTPLTPTFSSDLATAERTPVKADRAAISATKSEEKGELDTDFGQKALTVGQLVRIVMPGGSLDGIETRVLAQTVDILGQPVYRLDYQRQGQAISLPAECLQVVQESKPLSGETAIKATAAQLLQVLGKACPFVGPGLWTVRRKEVPAHAWGQLCRLVRET
jgi:hypothetical protein